MSKKNDKLKAYADAVVKKQPEKIQNALKKLSDQYRHLMALRGYARSARKYPLRMANRWPFSDSEEVEFKKTGTYKKMDKERKAIIEAFEKANKGYTLKTNTDVRSLQQQTNSFKSSKSVDVLAKNLASKARTELKKKKYPDTPTDEAVESFRKWLSEVWLSAPISTEDGKTKTIHNPGNATPGLSSHGRIQAIDFKVYKGGKQEAGTKLSTVESEWGEPGWSEKLKAAVESVSNDWEGPLQAPYEPWHFTYTGK